VQRTILLSISVSDSKKFGFLSPQFYLTNKIILAQMALCNVPYDAPNVKACLSLLSPEISAYALT